MINNIKKKAKNLRNEIIWKMWEISVNKLTRYLFIKYICVSWDKAL